MSGSRLVPRKLRWPLFWSLHQSLVCFSLIEESFFRHERTGIDDPNLLSVRSIDTENADAAARHSQVEEPGLNSEPSGVRQQPNGKRVFKGLFNVLLRQRAFQTKGQIVPVKLHI